jgi:hypothetical protein
LSPRRSSFPLVAKPWMISPRLSPSICDLEDEEDLINVVVQILCHSRTRQLESAHSTGVTHASSQRQRLLHYQGHHVHSRNKIVSKSTRRDRFTFSLTELTWTLPRHKHFTTRKPKWQPRIPLTHSIQFLKSLQCMSKRRESKMI